MLREAEAGNSGRDSRDGEIVDKDGKVPDDVAGMRKAREPR
jgi:hypothetical protein